MRARSPGRSVTMRSFAGDQTAPTVLALDQLDA
jgi:hypothetical protein